MNMAQRINRAIAQRWREMWREYQMRLHLREYRRLLNSGAPLHKTSAQFDKFLAESGKVTPEHRARLRKRKARGA